MEPFALSAMGLSWLDLGTLATKSCAGRKRILDISCVKCFWGHSWMYHMHTYFVLGTYYLTPAPWISPIVGTFGDIVGDTVRALG